MAPAADLPPGWETDLAVLRHGGSVIEDRGDHLLVRTPDNPGFHWGNLLFVTDEDAVDEGDRWVRTFQAAIPDATWVAVGLIRLPDDRASGPPRGSTWSWTTCSPLVRCPGRRRSPEGYMVRRLDGDDWAQSVARSVAENDRTGEHDPESYARFASAQVQAQRALSERDVAAFFGAFAGDDLVASLGIVRLRYDGALPERRHRRGAPPPWAGRAPPRRRRAVVGRQRLRRWVIVTEATNPAGRVYRSFGFEQDTGNAQAYRKPPRSADKVGCPNTVRCFSRHNSRSTKENEMRAAFMSIQKGTATYRRGHDA